MWFTRSNNILRKAEWKLAFLLEMTDFTCLSKGPRNKNRELKSEILDISKIWIGTEYTCTLYVLCDRLQRYNYTK